MAIEPTDQRERRDDGARGRDDWSWSATWILCGSCFDLNVAAGRERKLKLNRSLDDECRRLRHGACAHIGSGGGLRTSYVDVCSCACHAACPALGAPLEDMDDACDCWATKQAREARAKRLGIRYRKQWEIRRGSADSPDGESVISVSFLIIAAVMLALFIGGIVTAIQRTDALRYIATLVAVLTGLWLTWTAVLVVFTRLIVLIIRKITRKVAEQQAADPDEG